MNKKVEDMSGRTSIAVTKRTQHAVNTIVGLYPKGTTADDVIWDALKQTFPDHIHLIEELQNKAKDPDMKQ